MKVQYAHFAMLSLFYSMAVLASPMEPSPSKVNPTKAQRVKGLFKGCLLGCFHGAYDEAADNVDSCFVIGCCWGCCCMAPCATMGCIGGGIPNAIAGARSGFKKPFELKEAFITRDEMYDRFEDVTYAIGQGLITLELQQEVQELRRILTKKIDEGLSADAYMAQVLRQHEAHISDWFNGDFDAIKLPQTGINQPPGLQRKSRMDRFKVSLEHQGYEVIDHSAYSGNCFFETISNIFLIRYDIHVHPYIIRQYICDALLTYPDQESLLLNIKKDTSFRSIHQYITHMRQENVYGGAIELSALQELFPEEIVGVIMSGGEEKMWNVKHHENVEPTIELAWYQAHFEAGYHFFGLIRRDGHFKPRGSTITMLQEMSDHSNAFEKAEPTRSYNTLDDDEYQPDVRPDKEDQEMSTTMEDGAQRKIQDVSTM